MTRKLRSTAWFGGYDKDGFIHRSWMKNQGWPDHLFDGRPVFAKGDAEHLRGEGKDVRNIVGYVSGTHFVEGAAPDTGHLAATVTFLSAASTLPETIREAWDRGKKDLVGLSIDATGTARNQRVAGKNIKVAASITRVDSVDLIVDPGAGGGLVRMLEAADPTHQQEDHDMGLKERMLEAIRAKNPDKAASIDLATVTDEALETAYREAVATPPGGQPVEGRVRMVAPSVDPQTRNGLVYVDLAPVPPGPAAPRARRVL